ncbi:hypothetical protein TNCV_2936861 [Trichonephila clavipes]|nr:hypothetical protein TNCV_2936861 [Trichonephila clavipes]
MLTLMRIKIGPEAHTFAVKHGTIRIELSEIRASDASKEARTAHLEEKTSENVSFEAEKYRMYGAGIED